MSSFPFLLIDIRTQATQNKKDETMKKNQIRKSVAALAMAAVVSVSLLGYGCGSKSASSTAGVSGEFTGTAKGMGGDVPSP